MNSKYYDPKNSLLRTASEIDDHASDEDFVELKKDNLFHIGQSYEEEVAQTLYCIHCGGNQFCVAQGSYYTAIKCISCDWEVCIHQG